jgi:O-antigen/teichoic acid export membrane protein
MVFLLVTARPFIFTLYSEKYLESIIPFYIYLFILPVRIVIYGSALMALGQSKVILIRSTFDLLINVLLSIIFVHLFGYLGAAISTIATLYLWTVPYNLYKIGKGFNIKCRNTLPFIDLLHILFYSIACVPFALIFLVFKNQQYFFQLLIAGLFFFPPVTILLIKKRYLDIPQSLLKHTPEFIQSIIR